MRKAILVTLFILLAAAISAVSIVTSQWVKMRQDYHPETYTKRVMKELTAVLNLTPAQIQAITPLLKPYRETLTQMDLNEADAWIQLFDGMGQGSETALQKRMDQVKRVAFERDEARLDILLKTQSILTAPQRAAYGRLMATKMAYAKSRVEHAVRP